MTWTNKWQNPADVALKNVSATPFNPWDNMTRDELLVRHQQLKDALEKAKAAEMELRKYIVKRAFPNPTEGMNKVELGNGYELKANVKFNYRLKGTNDEIEAALNDIAKMGNEGSFIADRIVSWHPTFCLTEYRPLCEDDATEIQKAIRKRIDATLEITDAAPTLEIKGPKK